MGGPNPPSVRGNIFEATGVRGPVGVVLSTGVLGDSSSVWTWVSSPPPAEPTMGGGSKDGSTAAWCASSCPMKLPSRDMNPEEN